MPAINPEVMEDPIKSTNVPVQTSTSEKPEETGPTTNPTENSVQNTSDGGIIGGEREDNISQYITGVKLYAVIAGLTIVAFLMILDSTIVTTVRRPSSLSIPSANIHRRFLVSLADSIR
jgi:hypothetical protein